MTSSYGLKGRTAVVTGATRGIGRAVAGQLAAAGALVCVTARDADEVRGTAEELGGVGLAGSVGDPAHLREVTELALRAFGRIDVVVNNAATNQPYGPLMDADPGAWREAFAINVEAPLRLVQCAWRAWMREHGGSVVNICTEGAGHVGPHVGAYGTSKAALLHLTQQLAGELAPKVRVNSVSPDSSAPRWRGSCGSRARSSWPPGCRSGGSESRRTSRGPCCGWPRTRLSGSPAPICWWTGEPGSGRRTPLGGTPSATVFAHTHHLLKAAAVASSREQCDPQNDQEDDACDERDRGPRSAVLRRASSPPPRGRSSGIWARSGRSLP